MINAWTGEKYNNNNPSGIIIINNETEAAAASAKEEHKRIEFGTKARKEHKIPKQADKRSLFAWEMRFMPALSLSHLIIFGWL